MEGKEEEGNGGVHGFVGVVFELLKDVGETKIWLEMGDGGLEGWRRSGIGSGEGDGKKSGT